MKEGGWKNLDAWKLADSLAYDIELYNFRDVYLATCGGLWRRKNTISISPIGWDISQIKSITWVERFNVQARPGATTIIKEINPLLLKACALDPTS